MSEETTLMKDFLFFLSYFGTHLDNPALASVLNELNLADREAVTEAEMSAVLDALAEKVRVDLGALKTPAAAPYARLMNMGAGVVDVLTPAK